MKYLILIPFLFCYSYLAFAENINFIFELSTGARYDKTTEYVFQKDEKLSNLDWNSFFIPEIKTKFQASIFDLILADIGIETAIPIRCGVMEDYDYTNSKISQYSRHDLYLDKDFSIFSNIGYIVPIKNFSIIPLFSFSYKNMKLSAKDGYLQYPTIGYWTGNEEKAQLKGNIISYEYETFDFSFGTELRYKIVENWNIFLKCKFSPFVKINALDSHYLRSVQFYDTIDNCKKLSIESGFSYKKFFLCVEFDKIFITKGKTSSNLIGITSDDFEQTIGYNSGIEKISFAIFCGYKI